MKEEKRPTEVKTPEFRVSFPSVFKPKFNSLSGKNEYLVDALFPKKTTDMSVFKKALEAACINQWGSKDNVPKKLRNPIKDGDQSELEEYSGHWYITFKAGEKYQPLVIGTKKDANGKFIELNEKEFYGGCYARAVVNAYAYDQQVNKGVSFGLGNIQKLRDGERFGGGFATAEDSFSDIVEESDSSEEMNDFF